MPASDPTLKNEERTPGTARQRREERRVQANNFATPMARPRRKLSSSTAGEPPAVSRQPIGGMATPRRGTGKRSLANSMLSESWVGRRYDIALPVTGAEMRLPALPIIQVDWRFVSGILVFVFALLVYFFVFSPVFQVEVVDFHGLERLSPADLSLVVDAVGKPVIAVSPSRLEERLLAAFPDLANAEVKVILPAKISIVVAERQPLLVWKQGNTERWIDAEGMVFPVRGTIAASETLTQTSETMTQTVQTLITLRADNLPLPPSIVEAIATAEAAPDEASLLLAAAGLTLNGPRQVDPTLVKNVMALSTYLPAETELVYTEAHGLGWTDPGGWSVYFGSAFDATSVNELEQKQLVYQEIVKYLNAKGIKPVLVSVENVHAPYYRMER
jgi:cell division septal protein FtsQ